MFIAVLHVGLDVPTLKEFNDHVRLKVALKWYDLGVELLSIERVDIIKHDNPQDVEACCTEMFKFWLQEDTMASWTKLVRALRSTSVGQIVLADEIEKKFITGSFCDRIVSSLFMLHSYINIHTVLSRITAQAFFQATFYPSY